MLDRSISLRDRAAFYHRQLPEATRRNLNERGIADTFVEKYLVGWNGRDITVPVANRHDDIVFFKCAQSPMSGPHAASTKAEPNAPVEIYGWDTLTRRPSRVAICDGEFNRLVLEAHGLPAVASTAGGASFEEEWARHFEGIEHVYLCFPRGEAGGRSAARIAALIPKARIVELPEDVGDQGDVTDYFVHLKKNRAQFEALLRAADRRARDTQQGAEAMPPIRRSLKRAVHLKSEVRIAEVIGRYTTLRPSGELLVGRCPLHEDGQRSLRVYPDGECFHCFDCGVGGDVITFLQEKDYLTFGQALERLERIRYANEYPDAA